MPTCSELSIVIAVASAEDEMPVTPTLAKDKLPDPFVVSA